MAAASAATPGQMPLALLWVRYSSRARARSGSGCSIIEALHESQTHSEFTPAQRSYACMLAGLEASIRRSHQ
eukprot:2810999-Pleurochrysis_carterae.AAC.1